MNVSMAGHRARLRERFLRHGLQGFQDYETIELLLTYAIPRKDVKPIAKALLQRFGSLAAVLDAPVEDITEIQGLGVSTAILFRLMREMNFRYLDEGMQESEILNQPDKIRASLRLSLQGRKTECFGVIFLNQRHAYLQQEILFEGTVDRSAVFPREIIRRALTLQAKAIVIFHNHPGGSQQPSQADLDITRRIEQACAVVDLRLLDHFLLAGDQVLSFVERGWYAPTV